MLEPEWKRLGGLFLQEQGQLGAVWIAHDTETDCVHLYDACVFANEVLAVISEGLNARGKFPLAWCKKDKEFVDKLKERGCRTSYEPVIDMVEVTSRDIQERMRTGRFKVDARLAEWKEEFRTYYKSDAEIPTSGYPLMTATRIAMSDLKKARRVSPKKKRKETYPKVAMI
jgi:hypothetical protein